MKHTSKLLPILIVFSFIIIMVAAMLIFQEQEGEPNKFQKHQDIKTATYLAQLQDGDTIPIRIGKSELTVEIAKSAKKQQEGLMFRESLNEDEGMLFIHTTPRIQQFWMKNTFIPLDIIFIDTQHRIVDIHHNTIPNQIQERYTSSKPAAFTLETNAGWVDRENIQISDTLIFALPESYPFVF